MSQNTTQPHSPTAPTTPSPQGEVTPPSVGDRGVTPRQHTLFYGSSYDRGLDILLKMWPRILSVFPDAKLKVCYGWNLYDAAFAANNPERMGWKDRMNEQMKQPGIEHLGRISKAELKKVRQSCGIWAYPTYFSEINCITALECQLDGCVPVVMNYAALQETVQSGIKVGTGEEGEIYDEEMQEKYVTALLSLMDSDGQWKQEQVKGIEFAKNYDWTKIAEQWESVFV